MEAILFGEIQMTASCLSSIAAIGEYHVYIYTYKFGNQADLVTLNSSLV